MAGAGGRPSPLCRSILGGLSGQNASGTGSTQSAAASILSGLTATNGIGALSALLPQPTKAQIGRQMTFYVTPHTLPGASSAELDMQLISQQDAGSSLYQAGKATAATDTASRIARDNVTTRVGARVL